jgi:hypothetical protein
MSWFKMVILTVGTGWIAGTQIYNPNKRVIEGISAMVLAFILWSFSSLNALWLLLVMFPFPFAISLGNSNFVFALIIYIIYLVRVSSGMEKFTIDRTVTVPVLLIVGTYILSFYNVDPSSVLFKAALVHTGNFFSAILVMFLVINLVDSEEKLEKTMRIIAIGAMLVIAFTIIEMIFPGRTIIPNWLYTRHKARLVMTGIRMGGPFHDFELAAEFFAISVLIFFFMMVRAKRLMKRMFYGTLLVVDLMMMFATITRGAFISLFIGVVYLAFLSRKDLGFVRLVILSGAFMLMIFLIDTFVSQYTASGSLFDRLFTTTLERGIIPVNRIAPWGGAIERGMEHPIIGNGPGWDFSAGLSKGLWPHNLYLFIFNITGITGLAAFLFFLFRVGRATLPGLHSSLVNSPFPEALMKVLHVCFVMFVIDQIKIEYLRNDKYVFFVWIFFGLIIATYNVIQKGKIEKERLEAAPS